MDRFMGLEDGELYYRLFTTVYCLNILLVLDSWFHPCHESRWIR